MAARKKAKKTNRGAQERSKVAGSEDYEVRYAAQEIRAVNESKVTRSTPSDLSPLL